MPRIFDNLAPGSSLLPALQETLALSSRADFCVGYFNLRGWGGLAPYVDEWKPGDGPCRVLIGMQRLPHDDLRGTLSLVDRPSGMDNQTAHRLRVQLAEQLRQQLTMGAPTNADERTLRQLAVQLRSKKVVVKLFLRHPLHAKLYLLFRNDPINPIVGYLGSSNLTFAGLAGQGELNVDVLDHDAALKLKGWFQDRWNDRFCVDITDELLQIIEDSWAREALIPPYHVYLKMAYHLSHEARAGLAEFRIPSVFGDRLFDFQAAAVKIAAHHLNKRNGVLIGDVVGLGKTLMATAVARIFEDDYGLETLIICPKNLVPMWEDYVYQYQLRARVLSLSRVLGELTSLRRYRLVVIDESHNLRNREGRRYRAIQEYVRANESKCILLSATPYNKTYLDLSSQLRIFVEDDQDLGIRPERLLRELGEVKFSRLHQASPRTLAAFDFSEHADDWRDLMRLYLVRRTRSFIQDNYAETEQETGRKFLTYEDGGRSFFPTRVPRTVKFAIDESNPDDQYAKLYSQIVVDTVNELHLPRYGLGNYVADNPGTPPTTGGGAPNRRPLAGRQAADGLLPYEPLQTSGEQRRGLPAIRRAARSPQLRLPPRHQERTCRFPSAHRTPRCWTPDSPTRTRTRRRDHSSIPTTTTRKNGPGDRRRLDCRTASKRVPPRYTRSTRAATKDASSGSAQTSSSVPWRASFSRTPTPFWTYSRPTGNGTRTHDAKLDALHTLLTETFPDRKVLVFSQFADTVLYLEAQLKRRGVQAMAGVTGNSADPTQLAWRFSPNSNQRPGQGSSRSTSSASSSPPTC